MACTEKWSGRKGPTEQLTSSGRSTFTGEIVFQVTFAPTSYDAVTQLPFTIGSDHDEYGPLLRVNSIDPQKVGPAGFWEVHVGFSSETGITSSSSQRPRLRWSHDIVLEEVDRDFDGYPITNSVGDPPVNHPQREFVDLVLTYTRWESVFDVRKSVKYLNAVNNDDIVIRFGGGPFNGTGFGGETPLTVYKGEAKCTAFAPTGEYEEDQSLIQMAYEVKIRERIVIEDNKWASGWDWRFMDQGNRGWYLDGPSGSRRLGEFYLHAGEPATEQVRLDGRGVPIDEFVTCTSALKQVQAVGKPAGADYDLRYQKSDPGAVFLIYKRHRRLPFSGLLPIFK